MTTSSHQSFRDFRQSLARRGRARVFSGIMAMILGLIQALRILEDSDDAVIGGILFGLLVGMGLVVLVMGLQDARANRTDERARIAYNREQDERLREIRRRAGSPPRADVFSRPRLSGLCRLQPVGHRRPWVIHGGRPVSAGS